MQELVFFLSLDLGSAFSGAWMWEKKRETKKLHMLKLRDGKWK